MTTATATPLPKRIDFTLPGLPPSPNRTLASPLRKRIATKRTWRESAFFAAIGAGARRLAGPTAFEVTMTLHVSQFRDHDNATASCKAIRDGLAQALRIDDAEHRNRVRWSVKQEKAARTDARVEVTIWAFFEPIPPARNTGAQETP